MDITIAKYTEEGSIFAVIDGVEMTVPDDMGNRHRVALADWEAEGNVIEPYVEPPYVEPVPSEISRRQFFQQLAMQEVITRQEALAAISSGVIPPALETVIGQIEEEDEKFNAQMLLLGAQTFERLHPLSDTVKQIAGWTDEQRDKFWLDASRI